MAIETKKIIEISTAGAVTSVKELKEEINSLRDAWLNAEEGSEQYEAITNQLIEDQKKLNDVMRIGKNEASAATGSYNSLVNQMSALKTAWRSTTSEVQRAQLGEKIREINDQLKAYDESIGNHQRKVGSYEQALQALTKTYDSQKQELSALKTALDNLEPGTDAYNKAFDRAAEITHNLQERQEMLKMSANDLGTQLSNVANIGAGLVGGFNSINAIMTLTGNKNEDLQKTMVKLQAGIALVQGLKGLEGAAKSMKGYANWAAKAYDSIVDFISGSKKQQKQIQATTTATEVNTKANQANATSEITVAAGATTMNAGLKSAAGGFTTATVAATAFKAVLMSLGIGLIVAAISGLVTLLGKLGSKWINAGKEARENTYNMAKYFDEQKQKQEEMDQERFERSIELAKAQGKTELEILQMYEKRYTEHYNQMLKDVENYKQQFEEASRLMRDNGALSKLSKEEKEWANKMMADILLLQEKGIDAVGLADKATSEHFDNLKEKGAKTYKDLQEIAQWFWMGQKELAEDYQFNPLGATSADVEAEATSIIKTAQEAVSSETQILKAGYDADRAALNKYYDSISADTATRNAGLRALEKAHRKKMYDIITGATQSILDSAKSANQDELKNLEDKYQKELKILKKYHKDTTELTKAYDKERATIILNQTVKNTENAINELKRLNEVYTDVEKSYDMMVAAGVQSSKKLTDTHKAEMEMQYEQTSFVLEQTVTYWENIYKQIENDTNISADKRLEIWNKYIESKAALEEAETKHTLDQIKIRKDALAAEIEEIKKKTDAQKTENTKNTAVADKDSATGWGGFWNTWAGGVQNPSFEKQQQAIDIKFQIDIDSLNEQIAVYQKVIEDLNVTDAERTAAMEQQAELRNQITELEAQKAVESANIQIDKQKELINTIVDVGNSIGDILGSVADAWESSVQAQVKAGKMSEEEAEDEMERIRVLQIIQATINMLAGSFGAFAQASQTIPPPYGQIVGGVAAAAVIAAGIAQIAAIRAAGENSSASAGSTMMAQVTPVMTDYQPQMTGILTGEQETEKLANAMSGVNLWVNVTDIDQAQEKGRVRVAESTF